MSTTRTPSPEAAIPRFLDAASEETRARQLADRLGLPYVDLWTFRIDAELFRSIPLEWMLRFEFVPEKAENGSLAVVMADPADVVKRDELEGLLKKRLSVRVGSRAALQDILQKSESTQRVLEEATEEFRMQVVLPDDLHPELFGCLFEHALRGFGLLENVLEGGPRPDPDTQALLEEPLELVSLHDVGRIRHDHREGPVLRLLGHELEAEHPLERDGPEELGVDPERPEIDVRQPEAVGELAGSRLLGGRIEESRDRGFGGGGPGRAHAYPLLRPVRP